MKYIAKTVDDFYNKMETVDGRMQAVLAESNNRRSNVFNLLKKFNQEYSHELNQSSTAAADKIDKLLASTVQVLHRGVKEWSEQIEKCMKGAEFMQAHEKYLVLLVFGAVKTGKSSLGNLFAGRELRKAKFDNKYQTAPKPEFAIYTKGRQKGDIEQDENGDYWFCEGATDTTGAIQYYTLAGMRWMDSPGTGALKREGDTVGMEEMVNEYLPYADICIFLMNSSEPGVTDDMKYIEKLSRQGQEALVVITRSDETDEDEDEKGNILQRCIAKSHDVRKGQEDDIVERFHGLYPAIDTNRFRVISISTRLAQKAIENEDDALFRSSNIDKMMQIIEDKVDHLDADMKVQLAKRTVNNFIQSIIHGEAGKYGFVGIDDLQKELAKPLTGIREYQDKIEERSAAISKRIVVEVKRQLRQAIHELAETCEQDGREISEAEINKTVERISNSGIISKKIHEEMGKIIDNYQEKNINPLMIQVQTEGIKKESLTLEHTWTEIVQDEREPEGIWETVKGWFGAKYYRERERKHSKTTTVDLGTNVDDVIETVIPQIEEKTRQYVLQEFTRLGKGYFIKQEAYIKTMKGKLGQLKTDLEKMQYRDCE